MSDYKNFIVGLDLSDDCAPLVAKATSLGEKMGANITLIHVLEPLAFAYGGDIPMDLTEVQTQLTHKATERLKELAEEFGITECRRQVIVGQPASELQKAAGNLESPLIIVGSHGRHGLALLMGSTANAVLHGACCDILAIKV